MSVYCISHSKAFVIPIDSVTYWLIIRRYYLYTHAHYRKQHLCISSYMRITKINCYLTNKIQTGWKRAAHPYTAPHRAQNEIYIPNCGLSIRHITNYTDINKHLQAKTLFKNLTHEYMRTFKQTYVFVHADAQSCSQINNFKFFCEISQNINVEILNAYKASPTWVDSILFSWQSNVFHLPCKRISRLCSRANQIVSRSFYFTEPIIGRHLIRL